MLSNDEHLAIGVEEVFALHRFGDEQDMRRHAGLRFGVARRGHRDEAGDEGERLLGDRRWRPAQLSDRQIGLAGAVRIRPVSTFWNRPVCRTVGRMR